MTWESWWNRVKKGNAFFATAEGWGVSTFDVYCLLASVKEDDAKEEQQLRLIS